MISNPITSWKIDGKTMETVTDFIFFSSKITVDGEHSHGIKRPLLFGRKAMTNLDNILKSRDIAFPTKVLIVKAVFFSASQFKNISSLVLSLLYGPTLTCIHDYWKNHNLD